MSGYPSSPVFVYDPTRPWTVGYGMPGNPAPHETDPASNPRLLVRLNQFTRTHKMYGAAVGADGKVYFGGACMRNANGGGIGWWDPATEQAGGIWEPFTAYEIHWLIAADGGKRLLASTRAVRNDIRDNWIPEQAKLFVFDVAEGRIVSDIEPVRRAMRTGGIVEAMPGKILGATADPETQGGGLLYGVDLASGAVEFVKRVPYDFGFDTGRNTYGTNEYRKGPDGWIWTYIGKTLVRIHPATVRIEVLGVVDQPGRIAFAGDDIYLASTEHLRRIAEIVPRQ